MMHDLEVRSGVTEKDAGVKSRSEGTNENCAVHQCLPKVTHLNTIIMNLSYPTCTIYSLVLNILKNV